MKVFILLVGRQVHSVWQNYNRAIDEMHRLNAELDCVLEEDDMGYYAMNDEGSCVEIFLIKEEVLRA